MLKPSVLVLIAAIAGLLTACNPPTPIAYLKSAQDRATQQDVKATLGEPVMMKPMADGGSEWIYRAWDHDGGSRFQPASAWCDEYRLVFDARGVLRSWDRAQTRHVGEMMPATCRKAT